MNAIVARFLSASGGGLRAFATGCVTLCMLGCFSGCAWWDNKERELVYRPTPGRPADFPGLRAGDETFFVSVPGDARFLRAVRAFFQPLLEEAFGAEEAGRLVLALDEACSNIIKHCDGDPAGKRVTVQAAIGDAGVRFRVRDYCGAEDIPNIKPRDLGTLRPGGLGTHFIGAIMDRMTFEPEPDRDGRVALVLEKAIPALRKDEEA